MRYRNMLCASALALPLILGATTTASAGAWEHPGHHPLAGSREEVMNDSARRADFVRLGLSGEALEAAMTATASRGEMRDLANGENLGNQLYESGHLEHDVVVEFGDQKVDRRAERWRVTLSNGTILEIVLPYVCHNLSVKIIRPAPCDTVRIEITGAYNTVGVPVWGNGEDAECHGYRRLGSGPWQEFAQGCESDQCNYNEPDQALAPRKRTFTGEMDNLTPGWYEVRVAHRHAVDDGFRIGFCPKVVGSDGQVVQGANDVVVRPEDYRGGVARIYARQNEFPQDVSLNSPRGLAFDEQ